MPDLPERHVAHQRVEALAVLGTRRAVADIGIDDLNGLGDQPNAGRAR